MAVDHAVLQVARDIRRRMAGDCSMPTLAARAGWSAGHLHRAFRRVTGETPKQYTLRLRLERAAALLVTEALPVLDVALAVGFADHETFTRAFRRRFGHPPVAHRATALTGASPAERARHRAVVDAAGPCLGFHHLTLDPTRHPPRSLPVTLTFERRDVPAVPVLLIRRRAPRPELSTVLGECLGAVWKHAQGEGLAFAGPPFARYPASAPGLITIEAGMPLTAPAPGVGEIEAGTLGGPAVMVVHAGPYDLLDRTHAAIGQHLEGEGLTLDGAPWESYITDPGEHPDPADWRTEVYWPIREA